MKPITPAEFEILDQFEKIKSFLSDQKYKILNDVLIKESTLDPLAHKPMFIFRVREERQGYNFYFNIYYSRKIIVKANDISGNYIKLSMAELEFFDRLGYTIDSNESAYTKQYIEDWFGKV